MITQVDAFTDKPFAGNPAGVCVLERPASEDWMRQIAAEMNLSETAFLHPEDGRYRLRWFTPAAEVDLCGHATLASAHVLWHDKIVPEEQVIRFMTRSGLLEARKQGEWLELNFPAKPSVPTTDPGGLAEALGVSPLYIGKSAFDYLLEIESDSQLRTLTPDLNAIGKLPVRGVIVTARSQATEFDFVSRFFAPAVGVPEDPVTGSAHCVLGPYWMSKLGKNSFTAYQASKRGGVMRVRVEGDRVRLSGQAVIVMRCELTV